MKKVSPRPPLPVYPKWKRQVQDPPETLHGRPIQDPYRWLENPDSAETQKFVEAQNEFTNRYLEAYEHRETLRQTLTKMFDYERYGCPFQRGQDYFYFHNSGLQAQSVLYRQKGPDQQDSTSTELFFDPNRLSADGTAALSTFSFTESGSYFAYAVALSGSDWVTIRVKDARVKMPSDADSTTHGQLSDVIEWAKFTGISWTKDERGFFYSRYPKPESLKSGDKGTETDQNINGKLYYHRLGEAQTTDTLCYEDPENPTYMFGAEVTDDGKYAIVTVSESCDPVNKLYLIDLSKYPDGLKDKPEIMKIVDTFEAEYSYITNDGSKFYFKTNKNAPKYKIVYYDLNEGSFKDVIGERPDQVLQFAACVDESNLVVVHLKDVKNVLNIHDMTGKLVKELPLEIGSIDSLTGRKQDKEMFLKFSSFLNPGVIYRYTFASQALSVFRTTKLSGGGFDSTQFKTQQIFYPSADGTKIPAFIISRSDVQLNGENPTLLYGYGGFNISITPAFSPAWLTFIKHMHGVVCVANIRGGGEYGEEWHKAGSLHKKQNCFDDFREAAKWLIANGWTKPAKLSINGGSNGGLLVGASINQAPDLFGCAMADVGVMDMLRFHKFTIGHAWKSDYGDPDKKEDFEYVLKYSPVHNVQSKKPYPSVMLLTSDHDDRVVPLHSYKYIAELQHQNPDNPNPLLIRIETKAGHGAGKPTKKRIDEATDRFSFLALSVGAEWHD